MKTIMIDGKRKNITYRTNTEMFTRYMSPTGFSSQYGADVYNIDDDKERVVIVATSFNGSTITKTAKVITAVEYEKILELYDNYNSFTYHDAIMTKLGFK